MKITVCIGSSCHVKGSKSVVDELQRLIAENNAGDKVELSGTFCLGKCQDGVCVEVENEVFSVSKDTVDTFFRKEVLSKL